MLPVTKNLEPEFGKLKLKAPPRHREARCAKPWIIETRMSGSYATWQGLQRVYMRPHDIHQTRLHTSCRDSVPVYMVTVYIRPDLVCKIAGSSIRPSLTHQFLPLETALLHIRHVLAGSRGVLPNSCKAASASSSCFCSAPSLRPT